MSSLLANGSRYLCEKVKTSPQWQLHCSSAMTVSAAPAAHQELGLVPVLARAAFQYVHFLVVRVAAPTCWTQRTPVTC